ncbi:hypothetical protein UA74_16255 [Actinoalloteichus fjordicus]|uniref:TrbC/VIRB2 family protein n=2 Tax=Actinoalloteichus fjordicus TaxID=1612552 RepID=A0AAC9LFI9_9PSEU|nr:hypothetical protein UA74_16255 [Actinoalloteichus fjordicus]
MPVNSASRDSCAPHPHSETVLSDHPRQRPSPQRGPSPACPSGTGHPRSGRRARRRLQRRTGVRVAVVVVLMAAGVLLLASSAGARAVLVVAQAQSVDAVLTNVRDWLMGILAGLATVFLSVGGVRYVMAAGDPGEVEKAKGSFKSAGWGYGLAALAPLVVEILRGIVGV